MKKTSKRSKHKQIGTSGAKLETLENRYLLAADIIAFEPANLSTFVDSGTDIHLTFSDDVKAAAGEITIRNAADATVIETISAADTDRVTIDGTQAVISPAASLPPNTQISITVDDDAFQSTSEPIFLEDFEGVDLRELESETESGGDGTDWTDEFPAGWERDNTDTPEGPPAEFFGFTIFDKEAWIETAGNQGRANFTLGEGNVVVADGDEYDDGTDIDDDQFNVFLTTPAISLAGQEANSVRLSFDSSFRPYPTMVGTVEVSFDEGSSWDTLLTLDEDTVEGGVSSMSRANVKEILPVNNPAGGSVQFRFGMTDAGNDWWWAFDNVTVEVPSDNGDLVAGITDPSAWTFETSPGLSPATGAVAVAVNTNLEVTFDVDVKLTPGAGNIEIRRAADDSVFEIIPVASDRVSASGQTVTIDPINDLEENTEYYVLIDDFSIYDTEPVPGPGVTIFSEDFEDLPLQDSPLVGGLDINDYVVVMSGVLDVKVAGEYTFGGNSDDGQLLAIDFSGDGLDDPVGDAIIFDNATHGAEDRLTSCDFGLTACVGDGFQLAELENLAVGQYEFQYWYFERGGGSGGEFFYAPGFHEEFTAEAFAVVGDDSKGIGVTAEGITATTYKADVQDQTLDVINSLDRAEELVIFGDIALEEGFPVSQTIEFADVHGSGAQGRYFHNNPVPGFEPPEGGTDWSPDAPEGWTRESTVEDLGATPEFNGWTFLNKEFWIAQQGNQDRTTFEKGDNVLAVSDPDAIDDFIEIGGDGQEEEGIYDGWLATPAISLTNVDADTISLVFDSSFRPYPTMVGKVDVSFDEGGSWDTLLTLDENTVDGGVSSLSRANATEILEVNNPKEGTVMFRWLMEDAGNDWWWAVDNIRVTTPFNGNPLPGIKDSDVWKFTTGDDVPPTLEGDIDGNGAVEFADFLRLSAAFGNDVAPGTPEDIDQDGTVGFSDFLLLSSNFGKTLAEISPDVSAALSVETTDAIAASDGNEEEDPFGAF